MKGPADGSGSVFFAVEFDFFREHRTKQLYLHLRCCVPKEITDVFDEIDGAGKKVAQALVKLRNKKQLLY